MSHPAGVTVWLHNVQTSNFEQLFKLLNVAAEVYFIHTKRMNQTDYLLKQDVITANILVYFGLHRQGRHIQN